MMNFLANSIYYIGAFGLIIIGIYIVLVKHNLIKVIIGLSILDTGVNLFLIAVGYISEGTAPIFSRPDIQAENMVDPVPQALVLTAIVIGVAVLALALSLAIKLYQHYGTLNLRKIKEQRW
jgi:multicomponent Na+:H+ antiporter subunit C